MEGRDSRAIPFDRWSGSGEGIRRGRCRLGADAASKAASVTVEMASAGVAGQGARAGAGLFSNSMRLGGTGIRRVLSAGAIVVAAVLFPGVARGQAMGRITLDGPSPLPLAPRVTEPAPAATSRASDVNGASGAAAGRTNGTGGAGQGSGDLAARTPAPVPEVLPQEPPKPPASNPAVVSGGPAGVAMAAGAPIAGPVAAPVATPAATPSAAVPTTAAPTATQGSAPISPVSATGGTAESRPANDIERKPIRGAGSGGGAPANESDKGAKGGGSSWGGVGQVVAALAIVLGLIFIGRALVRKFVPGAAASNGKGVIEILARHPLSKNQAIVLVRIGSQIVALNQGREASESVLVISEPMEVARIIGQIEGKSPASMQAGFNRLLANARMDLESGEEGESKAPGGENLDEELEEMAAAKRQLMELRQHVRSVRDSLPRE